VRFYQKRQDGSVQNFFRV